MQDPEFARAYEEIRPEMEGIRESMDSFEAYVKQLEPSKHRRGYDWLTAIGLQGVDGLKTSAYLEKIARMNIEGKITFSEAKKLIEEHYR